MAGTIAAIRRVPDQWAAIQYRWWYLAGLAVLTFILEGPRAFLAHRLAKMSAILNTPMQVWGQWLIIAVGFALIGFGVIRSKRAEAASKEEYERQLATLATQDEKQRSDLAAAGQRAVSRLRDEIMQEQKLPNLMAAAYLREKKATAALGKLSTASARIEKYRAGYEKLLNNAHGDMPVAAMLVNSPENDLAADLTIASFPFGKTFTRRQHRPSPQYRGREDSPQRAEVFRAEDNAAFLDWHKDNLGHVQSAFDAMMAKAREEKQAADQLWDDVEREMRRRAE